MFVNERLFTDISGLLITTLDTLLTILYQMNVMKDHTL